MPSMLLAGAGGAAMVRGCVGQVGWCGCGRLGWDVWTLDLYLLAGCGVGLDVGWCRAFPHARTHALSHARSLARTHARTHARSHAHTHTHTYARTHVRTHARTHARSHTRTRQHTGKVGESGNRRQWAHVASDRLSSSHLVICSSGHPTIRPLHPATT